MYSYIKGVLAELEEDAIVVETGGIRISYLYDRSDFFPSAFLRGRSKDIYLSVYQRGCHVTVWLLLEG